MNDPLAAAVPAVRRSSNRRILLVEDDAAVAQAIAHILESEGYEVARASNGLEALDYLSAHPADLILLDLMMPVMNGYEFLKRRPDRSIPVVITTASGRDKLASADGWLNKPVSLDLLLSTVARFVSR